MGPGGRWYGVATRSQISGPTASVVRYNNFPRLLASPMCRILGLPRIGYFGDYSFLFSKSIHAHALSTFRVFFRFLGTILKDKKCSVGPPNTFLGLHGVTPSVANGMKLSISVDKWKSARRGAQLAQLIEAQPIDHPSPDKLIGELSFAQTSIFGKFARSRAQLLSDKIREPPLPRVDQ